MIFKNAWEPCNKFQVQKKRVIFESIWKDGELPIQACLICSKQHATLIHLTQPNKSSTFSIGFRGISRLGFAFILRWFKLVHMCIQVTSFHKWKKQVINHKFLIGKRFHVTLPIVSPIICKQCIRCETLKVQHKVRENKQPQDCNEKTAQTQPQQIKQNQNIFSTTCKR